MKRKTFLPIGLTIAIGIVLAACGPRNIAAATPQVWIDAPLQGSTIPLAPYQIIAHAGFPSSISQFELTITGQGPETIPSPADQAGQTLVYINHTWTPPAPGTYLIQVRAAAADGTYGPMAEVQVQVGDTPAVETPASGQGACIWTAAVNVFVRTGPGASIYPEITAVEAGKFFPVVGQSQDQQFWALKDLGYVPKDERFGLASGNCDVPILVDPATPVPTDTPRVPPQCSDGIDNDGDGKIDFNSVAGAGDRQCRSPDDNDEANP